MYQYKNKVYAKRNKEKLKKRTSKNLKVNLEPMMRVKNRIVVTSNLLDPHLVRGFFNAIFARITSRVEVIYMVITPVIIIKQSC